MSLTFSNQDAYGPKPKSQDRVRFDWNLEVWQLGNKHGAKNPPKLKADNLKPAFCVRFLEIWNEHFVQDLLQIWQLENVEKLKELKQQLFLLTAFDKISCCILFMLILSLAYQTIGLSLRTMHCTPRRRMLRAARPPAASKPSTSLPGIGTQNPPLSNWKELLNLLNVLWKESSSRMWTCWPDACDLFNCLQPGHQKQKQMVHSKLRYCTTSSETVTAPQMEPPEPPELFQDHWLRKDQRE